MCALLYLVCTEGGLVIYDGIVGWFDSPLQASVSLKVEVEVEADFEWLQVSISSPRCR